MTVSRWGSLGVLLLLLAPGAAAAQPARAETPADLLALAREFREWRRTTNALAPDYAAVVAGLRGGLPGFQRRLEALRRDDWPVSTKVDYLVVRSEMAEIDFDLRIVRPWSRNPHFYAEEAIAAPRRHVGGRYQMGPGITVPYDAQRAEAIIAALQRTPTILDQARRLLTEPVGEMGDAALETLTDIRASYQEFGRVVSAHVPESHRARLVAAADAAGVAMQGYREWIAANRARMTAPYAIGRTAFEWYVRYVLMLPYTSEQLLMQAQQERDRGWAFLAMERQRNRHLPPLAPAPTNARYSEWKDATDVLAREWAERHELFTRPDHVGAMRHYGDGVYIEPFGPMGFPTTPWPKGEKREFLIAPDHPFTLNYWNSGHRVDPAVNHPHSDYPGHTFEGAVSQRATSEIRRGHNSRGDSWCYYMEEAQLQLDFPFVNGPRVRERMYGLHIMRAERVYSVVKFADGSLPPKALAAHFMKSVPWMEPHVAERHEVWRKFTDPGQVLTYQVGRTEVYRLMGDRMKQLGDRFDFRAFHDELLATGQISVALARWEMTGLDDDAKTFWDYVPITAGTAASAPQ